VRVLTGRKALRCDKSGDRKNIVVEHQGQEIQIEFDALLCAVGRVAHLSGYGLDDLDRAIADSEAQGFVKVLTVPGKGKDKILGTIHTYPTLAEANKYAAGEWKRAHQPKKLLEWVERYHAWRRG
jgi:hypothetical protein